MKLAAAEHQAVMWEVRLREDDIGASVLNEFDHWRTAEAANEQAWNALQQRLARIGGAQFRDGLAMARALRTPATERRRALRAAFGLLVLGCGTWGIREGMHGLGLDADWQSAVGERGEGLLADGTPVAFDANSRIYLAGSAQSPRLKLHQGQVLVKSWPHRDEVLTVSTMDGAVVTEGATFNVGKLLERSVVSVSRGSALLRPQLGRPVLVSEGETFYFNGKGAQQTEMPFGVVSAWTRGVCVADRMPLAELLDIFGRYRKGLLRVSGRAAALQISGVFRLEDIERALLQVVDILPVRMQRYGSYLTVFSAA
ncbi:MULTISPECIES: FecR domain-containing protein [unclassified Duganella]|uniref:FecR family protein n=1 Tax=unclassified Duganella TaxID=2636909 RepID=UPI00088EA9F2|nr:MULTISPECIES: FecR domain-containing protein [unclassified Duganella]SDF76766.1 FecR family protein [Duganella sp. OV458]SDI52517.1 FecR family protein [Duganella sp. OV510]